MLTSFLVFLAGEFDDVLDDSEAYTTNLDDTNRVNIQFGDKDPSLLVSNGSVSQFKHHKLLKIENLTLQTPRTKNVLITDLSMEINDKEHLLVRLPTHGLVIYVAALVAT